MKTATANALIQLAKNERTAFWILKVVWDSVTAYYSDAVRTVGGVTTEQRISQWNSAAVRLGQPLSWSVNFLDPDGAMRVLLGAQDRIAGHKVTLCWAWPGAAQADWLTIVGGLTDAPYDYDEQAATIDLPVKGIETKLVGPASAIASLTTLPYALSEHQGRNLPLVYGRRSMVRGVLAAGGGPETRLTTALEYDDPAAWVKDASKFPASSNALPIYVWFGRELMRGFFAGDQWRIMLRPVVYATNLLATFTDAD